MKRGESRGRNRPPVLEQLEPRLLLDGLTEQQAIQFFNVSPALFAENQGQWADESIRYVHNGAAADVAMTDGGIVFRLFREEADEASDGTEWTAGLGPADDLPGQEDHALEAIQFSVSFVGANTVRPVGLEQAETYFNYFIGEQANWRQNVPTYEVVAYQGLYQGIELLTFGLRSHLKYEFHVSPGADYERIQVRYEGIEGLSLAADGSLRIQTALGELYDDAPHIYQVIAGQTVEIPGQFLLLDEFSYGFAVTGSWDPTVELVIDPDLAWGSFLAGSYCDWGEGIAADAAGNALLTGETWSSDFPTLGGFDTSFGGGYTDAFVAKVSPTGLLAWASFLGGSDSDHGWGIAADSAGNALVTGYTESSDFPTPGGFDTSCDAFGDAFVAKVSPTGSLVWASFLGGSMEDYGYGVAADAEGNALLTGYTRSSDFPTPGGFDTSLDGTIDAFVAKVTSSPSSCCLAWASFLGGSVWDEGYGIAADAAGNALLTGYTGSGDFPTPGGFDTSLDGGDAFVAKVTPAGLLAWASFLGGSGWDEGHAVAADGEGNALLTGWTRSSDFPTPGGFDTSFGGPWSADAFVAKVSPTGSLVWASFLGGSEAEEGYGIAADGAGNALVTGWTASTDFPTPGGFDTTCDPYGDAFVAQVTPAGLLAWATFLGGTNADRGYGIVADGAGNALLTGQTYSVDFPTPGGFDTSYGWAGDAFVVQILLAPHLPGDANLDGCVDALDYNAWSLHYFQPGRGWRDGNFNGDILVDGLDYNIWSLHYLEELGEGSAGGPAGAEAAGAAAEMESLIGRLTAAGEASASRADSGPLSSMADLPMAPVAATGKLLVAEGSPSASAMLPAERASDQSAQAKARARVETASRDGHEGPLEQELDALTVPSLWVLRSAV